MIRWMNRRSSFPDPETADAEGVVAVGGDCDPERLLLAYRSGIFPWPISARLPLLWFSPDPRWVVEPQRAHIPKSLRKQVRRGVFTVRSDTHFAEVIDGCARTPRPGQASTWIVPALREGFLGLHRMGLAHSIEAWEGDALVGGLYGLSLGSAFFGESMFAQRPDASKVAFAVLLGHLNAWGFSFVDCQTRTEHLERFGAKAWTRLQFLEALRVATTSPTRPGPWSLDLDPAEAIERIVG